MQQPIITVEFTPDGPEDPVYEEVDAILAENKLKRTDTVQVTDKRGYTLFYLVQ